MRPIKVGDRVYLRAHLPLYLVGTSERTEWIVCKVEDEMLTVTRAYFGHGNMRRWPISDFAYVIDAEAGGDIQLGKDYGDGRVAVAYGHFDDQVLCLCADGVLRHFSVGELDEKV